MLNTEDILKTQDYRPVFYQAGGAFGFAWEESLDCRPDRGCAQELDCQRGSESWRPHCRIARSQATGRRTADGEGGSGGIGAPGPRRAKGQSRVYRNDTSVEDEISQILKIRGELEVLAVELAAENATEADIGQLLEITREMKSAAEAKDVQEFFAHDFRFHERLWRASGNTFLPPAPLAVDAAAAGLPLYPEPSAPFTH